MVREKRCIQQIAPYPAGKPIDEVKRELGLSKVIKLASNENPYGCSEKAKAAMADALQQSSFYPDGYCYELRNALAKYHDLDVDNFAFGTGSDGLIELICKSFLEPGDECVIPTPSFSLYETNIRATNAVPIVIPTDENYCLNLPLMTSAITERTKIIWLCNPNNPTGVTYSADEQDKLLKEVPNDVLVVLDEAYYEFAKDDKTYPDSKSQLARHDNIIILRTFSKVYGLAGLRVGYAMAHKDIISQLERVRAPFNVNLIAQRGAIAALDDTEFVSCTIKQNNENRKLLCSGFDNMGLSYLKSNTNFVAVNIQKDSKTAYDALLRKGYIVKGGHSLGMPGYLRVSVGTKEECEGFLTALEEVLKEI